MTDNVINFAEAGARIKAAKLRTEDTPVGRCFRNLETGPNMEHVSTEQLIHWAHRIANASDSDTMEQICNDIEQILQGTIK